MNVPDREGPCLAAEGAGASPAGAAPGRPGLPCSRLPGFAQAETPRPAAAGSQPVLRGGLAPAPRLPLPPEPCARATRWARDQRPPLLQTHTRVRPRPLCPRPPAGPQPRRSTAPGRAKPGRASPAPPARPPLLCPPAPRGPIQPDKPLYSGVPQPQHADLPR